MSYQSKFSGAEVDSLLEKVQKGEAGGKVTVDSSLSTTSENPVMNKAITSELNKKATKEQLTELSEAAFNISLEVGKFYYITAIGSKASLTSEATFSSALVPCNVGDVYCVTGRGSDRGKTWFTTDADGLVLRFVGSSDMLKDEEVTILDDEAFIGYNSANYVEQQFSLKSIPNIIHNNVAHVNGIAKEVTNTNAKLDATLDELRMQVGIPAYKSEAFTQGYLEYGKGIVNSLYYVVTPKTYPVQKGDLIHLKPNGDPIHLRILRTNDLINSTYSVDLSGIAEETIYTATEDGYLVIVASRNGQFIRPADVRSEFLINAFSDKIVEMEQNTANALSAMQGRLYTSAFVKPKIEVLYDLQDTSEYILNGGNTDTDAPYGKVSIRLSNSGSLRLIKKVIDVEQNDLVVMCRINSLSNGSSFRLNMFNISNASLSRNFEIARSAPYDTIFGKWMEIVIPHDAFAYTNDGIDFSKMQDLYFYIEGQGDVNIQYIGYRRKSINTGMVSFTFDDGWATQKAGVKTLAKYGIPSTLFVIKGALENPSEEWLSLADLAELADVYHADIQCHGPSPYEDMTDEKMIADMSGIQQLLKNEGLSKGEYMAYPSGSHTDRVVKIAKRYYKACRTINSFLPLESYPVQDEFRIRARSSVLTSEVDKIKELIDRAKTSGEWLILVFHKIEEGGSDGMYCSLEALEEMGRYARESGINILSFKDAFETTYPTL